MYRGEQPVGDPLDDNSEHSDDYRYHNVFHLAHMAVLGWSPVMRRLLGCKRSELPTVDRVQDGGRAAAIEEGLTAYMFTMAGEHSFFSTLAPCSPECAEDVRENVVPPRSIGPLIGGLACGDPGRLRGVPRDRQPSRRRPHR